MAPTPDSVRAAFEEAYGKPPVVVVRAPGRVNLIGEHTDYSGLPVLPIAIEQSLYIACAPTADGTIRAASDAFPQPANFARADTHPSGAPWHRYIAAAVAQLPEAARGQGADILIQGDLPATGGLSSSSALTVGVLAVLANAWANPLDDEALAQRAIVAERFVGVESGGMDQTVIVFGEAGKALRIDFVPPARTLVPIPEGLRFVVASSGEEAPKGGSARDAYNERVVGARIAASMLSDEIGVDLDLPPTLGQVSGIDVVDILIEGLPEKVSPQEVAHGTGVQVEHLVQLTTANFDHMAKVPVKRIARHILAEADRVDLAQQALIACDLREFGAILNDSHNSLREDFRCSTATLDRLCAAMRKAGALGARLTGAGFGGYALAACTSDTIQAVIDAASQATGGPAFEVHASDGLRLQ
jgi:galactokinase